MGSMGSDALRFVLEIIRAKILKPILQLVALFLKIDRSRLIDHLLGDEDGRTHREGDGNGVARAGIDYDLLSFPPEVDHRVVGILLEVIDDDLFNLRTERAKDVFHKIMGHGSMRT